MKFTPLGEIDLTYVGPSLDFVDYGAGGQYFASLEGTWHSDRIRGRLRLINLAQKRVDNINTPALRGVLHTEDDALIFVEMNGLSQIQEGGRVFVSSLTMRTVHPRYQWVNTFFGVVEGELHGAPIPNQFGAHCRVYACETTITPISKGGDHAMRPAASVLPVTSGKEDELLALARELKTTRSAEFDEYHRKRGVTREAAFLQRTPYGSQVIIYKEGDDHAASHPYPNAEFTLWLKKQATAIYGFDPAAAPQPKVELLIRQRAPRPGRLYAMALQLPPGKTARVHEFAAEINGIHAAEFEESLRRLGFGLAFFLQHTPQADLTISVVESDEPGAAFGRLVMSQHPFDRWHVQQIVDQTGLDLTGPPPPPNEELWSWEAKTVRAAGTEG